MHTLVYIKQMHSQNTNASAWSSEETAIHAEHIMIRRR